MTRCECHDQPFVYVLEYVRRTGERNFETVCQKSGCGQTCTACHCDLKRYLQENLAPEPSPAEFLPEPLLEPLF